MPSTTSKVIDALLKSAEPSIRFKVLVNVLGEDPDSKKVRSLRNEIRNSPRVKALLHDVGRDGRLIRPGHPYAKWQGAHWVLAALADLGYPSGDRALHPMRDQVLDAWLREHFYQEFDVDSKAHVYGKRGVPRMNGRYRRCGSQQGNALYSIHRLGIANPRCDQLAERLLHWQWPDGGWNCDKEPSADTSSFMETLLPMLGFFVHAEATGDKRARAGALRAAEVFLTRRLYKRRSDGRIIHPEFTRLHYPLYWHYDFLGGLKAMVRMNLISDKRCNDALDALESKRLPDGGWPAEQRYYKKVSREVSLGTDYVDWGGTGARRMNEWVTADALAVLRAAGRVKV
jgi:hypothetical protein